MRESASQDPLISWNYLILLAWRQILVFIVVAFGCYASGASAVRDSKELHDGAGQLAIRAVELTRRLLATDPAVAVERGGRKAHRLIENLRPV